ncbi:MAG: DUF952 domain-containing protein [Anaerolineae bacterium]
MIYHILTIADWQAAYRAGRYTPTSLAHDGFIHFSQAHQVLAVANAFYRDVGDLVLLGVEPSRLTAPLRYEPPAHPQQPTAELPHTDLFPHLYGALNLDAIVMVWPLLQDDEGFFLPFSLD